MRKYVVALMVILLAAQASAQSVEVSLDSGWNVISGSQAFSADDLSRECPVESVGGKKIWGFVNDSWIHHQVLKSNLGYYVFSEEGCSAQLTVSSDAGNVDIGEGWSMISGSKDGGWKSCSPVTHDGKVAWGYRGDGWQTLSDLSQIDSSRGYWIKNSESCPFEEGKQMDSLTIVSGPNTEGLQYRFEVSERPEPVLSGGNESGEGNDEVSQISSGYLVEGATGSGAGDGWKIPADAEVSGFDVTNYPEDRFTLFFNEEVVDPRRFGYDNSSDSSSSASGLKSVKKDSRFELDVNPPECDASNSDVKIIDENSDWNDINSDQYDTFCVQSGDYRDAGPQDDVNRIELKESGSEGDRRYILYDGPSDNHPVNQDSKAWVSGLHFTSGASYWTVQGISVDPRNSRAQLDFPIRFSDDAEHNTLDKVFAGAPDNEWTETYITYVRGDYTTIQNSVMRNTLIGGDAYCINANGPKVEGMRIVSNELYDCTDSLQLSTVYTDEPSFPGAIIAHNDMYFSPRYHADGNGNRVHASETDTDWRCGENALDFKAGSKESERPVRVIGNKMWNYADADSNNGGCSASGTGPTAAAFVIHNSGSSIPENIEVRNNIVFRSETGIGISTIGSGVEVENNLIYNYAYLDANNNPGYGLLTYENGPSGYEWRGTEIKGNTLVDGREWITAREQLTLKDNVFVNSGKITRSTSAETDGNSYYGDSERWGDESNEGNPSVSEAEMQEFCVTLRGYTEPRQKCFPNAVSTVDSPHGENKGFRPPGENTSSKDSSGGSEGDGEVDEDALYLHESFENGPGWFGSNRVPDEHEDEALNFVSSPTRHGDQAMQLYARHPDEWDYSDVNSNRVEMGLHANRWELWNDDINVYGEPFWFSFSVYVPQDWELTQERKFENIAEFHANWNTEEDDIYINSGAAQRKPWEMVANTKDDNFYFSFINGHQDDDGTADFDSPKLDVERGKWHDIVVHVNWARYDDNYDGFMDIWVNDEKVYDYEGATTLSNDENPRPLKLSIYDSIWDNYDVQERELVFDDVRIAKNSANYQDMVSGKH